MYWSPVFDCSHTSPLFWRTERALHLLEERGVERGHLRCEGLSVRYGALREDACNAGRSGSSGSGSSAAASSAR